MREKTVMKKVIRITVFTFLLAMLFSMTTFAANGANLREGKSAVAFFGNTNKMIYHKFTISRDGEVKITGMAMGPYKLPIGLSVRLYNAKKKALCAEEYLSSDVYYSVTYTLKKGSYYIGVPDERSKDYGYSLSYDFSTIKEKSGTTKKKAVSIKKNKTVYGAITVGESGSKADWYKFNLTKNQQLRMNLTAKGTAHVTFTLYGPAFKKGQTFTVTNRELPVKTINNITEKAFKIPKGMYYIKVAKSSGYKGKTYSGKYSISWS